jgi:hypothetical protein
MTAASITASLGLGALGFSAYALGYFARARHVTTAAEARTRRQTARGEKSFKRWCKRHAPLVQELTKFVDKWDGNRDMSFPGGVLHMSVPEEILRQQAKNMKGWLDLWADEAALPPRKDMTSGVSPRHRVGKYLRPNQPAQYGSSKRGKQERLWANIMMLEQMMPGAFMHTATGKDLEHQAKLVGFDPERAGEIDARAVAELFKSDIVPLVPKT